MKLKDQDTTALPHIGKFVATYIKRNNIFKSALARYLQKSSSGLEYYMKRPTLQIKLLWDISHALQHNFFTDLAAQLPAHFSSDSPIDSTKDELINSLQEENKQLTTQVATLQSVLNAPQKR